MVRKRGLGPEDEALWQKVARSARPLHPEPKGVGPVWTRLPRISGGDAGLRGVVASIVGKSIDRAPIDRPPRETLVLPPAFRIGQASDGQLQSGRSRMQTAPRPNYAAGRDGAADAPVRMDGKAYTRLTKGKLVPEARIDLHGMTQAEARPALTGFILRAEASGLRLVLVITGKGRMSDDDGPVPQRHGVLRHQVPNWLHQPPLASQVLQVVQAHQKHGGAGAFYVYLRRAR